MDVSIFNLDLKARGRTVQIEVPVQLPFDVLRITEFSRIIISSFDLPISVENEVETKLKEFIEKENFRYLGETNKVKEEDVEKNIQQCIKLYREETLKYNPPEIVGDDEVFAEAYHALVHSTLLGTLLRKESAFNSAIKEMHRLKADEIYILNEKQNQEMTNAISNLTNNNTAEVNRLAQNHFDRAHMVRTRWQSLIESEMAKQKREYRDWIVKTYQDYFIEVEEQNLNKDKKKKHSVRFDETLMISYGDEDVSNGNSEEEHILQESFTIHLGSQMKQTYNIRLFSSQPMEFLRFRNESSRGISPQRLQTAISIYSSDLSGLVLMTDSNLSIFNGIGKDVSDLCQQTTEFHFGTLESQFECRPEELKPGDFIITKHSNLNGAQVLFFLIADQQTLQKTEINSRDPVILGLRNILKTACLNDITTITIPALLANEMTEVMAPQWSARRAELVYKCVKGFMIEMGSWGGEEMKNLQFFVPKDVSEEVFNNLANMLPNIFRISNPITLRSGSSHSLSQSAAACK